MPLLLRHQYLEGRPTLVCHRRLDDDRPRRPLRGDNLTGGDRAATQRNYDSRVAMCVSHQCHRGRCRAIDLFVRVLPTNAVRLSVCPRPPAHARCLFTRRHGNPARTCRADRPTHPASCTYIPPPPPAGSCPVLQQILAYHFPAVSRDMMMTIGQCGIQITTTV